MGKQYPEVISGKLERLKVAEQKPKGVARDKETDICTKIHNNKPCLSIFGPIMTT